jgi:hypothetical protein
MWNIEKSAEKQLYDILLNRLLKAWYKKDDIVLKKIKDDIWSVWDKKNIWTFCKNNWEILLNTEGSRKDDEYFNKWAYLAWFREIKSAIWEYNMFYLNTIDTKTGKPKNWAKPIDKYSYDYYKAWVDIKFYRSKLWLETFKLEDKEWWYSKMSSNSLDRKINTGAIRLVDMLDLVDPKKWVITKEQFFKYLPQLQAMLLSQIWDPRFERLWDPINIKEITFYKEEKLISDSLFKQAKKKIEDLEKAKKNKATTKKEIHSQTQIETKEVYSS